MPEVRVELQFGSTWVDVTNDVRVAEDITITRGRRDESARAAPGSCRFTLDNRGGRYTPRHPASPYYGMLGRNTPARVSVHHPGLPNYLALPGAAGARASVASSSALDTPGDLDVRLDFTVIGSYDDTVNAELIGRYSSIGNQRGWNMLLNLDNTLVLRWSTDGVSFLAVDSTLPLPTSSHRRICLRATLDVDNGAGGHTVSFFTGPSLAGPWTQLGETVTRTGTTSINVPTVPLEVGEFAGQGVAPFTGRVHAVQIRNGIDGTIVANADFTTQTPGATSFVDGAGRTWSIEGTSEIVDGSISRRFAGEVSAWPTRWDPSDTLVVTPVEGAGIMRRLGQGASPLRSTLRRAVPRAEPTAYWPMEEERGAAQAYSPLPGVGPLLCPKVEFGADEDVTGSLPLPKVSGGSVSGAIPVADNIDSWQIVTLMRVQGVPSATNAPLLWVTSTGTAASIRVEVVGSDLFVSLRDAGGSLIDEWFHTDPILASTLLSGRWCQFQIQVYDTGAGSVSLYVLWFLVGEGGPNWTSTSYSGTLGAPSGISTAYTSELDIHLGHITVFPDISSALTSADNGFEGDRPAQRIGRLCAEEGIPVELPGVVANQTALGPQRADTLLALVQAVADADGGILGESREALGLKYRPAYLLFNQEPALVLDYAAGHLAPPLEPNLDDQGTRNDITITRRRGSSARAVQSTGPLSVEDPPAGVGRYDEALTLDLYRDEQLVDAAGWRLHLGTADETRYASVTIDLAARPDLIPAVLALAEGDRIVITNPPAHLPPDDIDLIVQGSTERIGLVRWTVTLNCSPGRPWQVAVADDDALGRADTEGSELAAGAGPTATTLSIATTSGPLWTTDPADYPLDLAIAGERVRVITMSGATSPQSATVTRSANGVVKSLPAGADVRLWQPMILSY